MKNFLLFGKKNRYLNILKSIRSKNRSFPFNYKIAATFKDAITYLSCANYDYVFVDSVVPLKDIITFAGLIETKQPLSGIGLIFDEPNIGDIKDIKRTGFFSDKANFIEISALEPFISKIIIEMDNSCRKNKKKKTSTYDKVPTELKFDFISNISHELRTPLAIIKESISVLSEDLIGESNDVQKYFIDVSLKNIDRLSKVINNIIDMSKIEANNNKVCIEDIDLNEIINKVCKIYKDAIFSKSLSLSIDLAYDLPQVQSDVDKLQKILHKILDNAIKFSKIGGEIYIGSKINGGFIEIFIRDSGQGIPERDLMKVFNKFHQVENIQGPGEHGTGLGLTIADRLVKLLNGVIKIDSEVGNGTTFTIILPIKYVSKKQEAINE